MANAKDLHRVTAAFSDDMLGIAKVVGDTSTGVNAVMQLTTMPRIVAGTLDGIADPLTIPKTVLDPMKLVPYGVGAAVKKYDKIAGLTIAQIRAQADRAWTWDEKLQKVNNFVEPLEDVLGKIDTLVNGVGGVGGLDTIVEQQAAEAARLRDAVGGAKLKGSELGRLISDRYDALEPWDADVLAELKQAASALGSAVGQVAGALPDTSALEDARRIVDDAVGPISDAFDYLDGILDKDYTVTPRITVTPPIKVPAVKDPIWGTVLVPGYTIPGVYIPAVTVNPADVMATISSLVGVVQDFIETLVLDALAAIGIDLFGAIDELGAALMAPLQPLFDAVDALDAVFDDLVAAIAKAVDLAVAEYGKFLDVLENIHGAASFFDWTVAGDAADDVLQGFADQVDGIFGMAGDDTLSGGAEDFLFGGTGADELTAFAGAELFGGGGADLLSVVGSEGSVLFGGGGKDTILGGDGDDLLDGGTKRDVMKGGLGDDTYVVDHKRDRIVEETGGGADHVRAWVSYRLAESVESATLKGKADANLKGNGQANVLKGNDGDNVLSGRGGEDTLTGRGGQDYFEFRARDEAGGARITDFGSKDKLLLDDGFFWFGTSARTMREMSEEKFDKIFEKGFLHYDAGTGKLKVDRDGRGGSEGRELLAVIEGGGALDSGDFMLF